METRLRFDPLGVREVAELLGLSPSAVVRRARRPDFPAPRTRLASGPLWHRDDVLAYASERSQRYFEREGVERAALEAPDKLAGRGVAAGSSFPRATIGSSPSRWSVAREPSSDDSDPALR